MSNRNKKQRLLKYISLFDSLIFSPAYDLVSLYRSPNIARVIKSRRSRWAGHVARMEEGRSAFKI